MERGLLNSYSDSDITVPTSGVKRYIDVDSLSGFDTVNFPIEFQSFFSERLLENKKSEALMFDQKNSSGAIFDKMPSNPNDALNSIFNGLNNAAHTAPITPYNFDMSRIDRVGGKPSAKMTTGQIKSRCPICLSESNAATR